MSLSRSSEQLRELCEDQSWCRGKDQRTFYCVHCDCSFCDACWDKQPALVVERYRDILEPSVNAQVQNALHKDDENTTWFGIGRNEADEPIFEDHGRFATLMAQSLSNSPKTRYPQLVSFIGQTGILNASISLQIADI